MARDLQAGRGVLPIRRQFVGAVEQAIAGVKIEGREPGRAGQRVTRIGIAVEQLDPPGTLSNTASCSSRFTATAPIGTAALVSPFAIVMMSGVTPQASDAVAPPTRPKAVMTSSKIKIGRAHV